MNSVLKATTKSTWRRKWQPTPICLLGKSHGKRSLTGYSPWVTKSWTKQQQQSQYGQRQKISSVNSVTQSICDPMNYSTPGLPVHHQFPELTQTHVHRVGDAIQPSHPLLSPSPSVFNLSQYQGLFQRVSSSHQVANTSASASVLPMNIQD